MARLIDAHDLWADIMMLPHNGDMISSEGVEQAIIDAPTVDAVEVVRCGKCRYCDPEGRYCDHPMSTSIPIPRKQDDFCSYGERRCEDE